VLFGTVLIITSLAIVISYQLTPRYTATAVAMIDARETNVTNLRSVMSGIGLDVSAV
jgi:uncharacterized protein involved in exopolysaccharide biosynthesis